MQCTNRNWCSAMSSRGIPEKPMNAQANQRIEECEHLNLILSTLRIIETVYHYDTAEHSVEGGVCWLCDEDHPCCRLTPSSCSTFALCIALYIRRKDQ